jgi:hypothetical protein
MMPLVGLGSLDPSIDAGVQKLWTDLRVQALRVDFRLKHQPRCMSVALCHLR